MGRCLSSVHYFSTGKGQAEGGGWGRIIYQRGIYYLSTGEGKVGFGDELFRFFAPSIGDQLSIIRQGGPTFVFFCNTFVSVCFK